VNSQPKNAKHRPEQIIELLLTIMSVISAVAQFERDLLLERTHSRIARASWKAIWSPFSTE
jgi:DNA invertase Pin-like site-specific DNA recombinase